ncbi:MAG: RnfABCDGE type electron transport complex subunit C, partial [Spirochaetaceae bacterium]
FPTHIKLATKDKIDTVIVNGAECEPYITVDDRLMQESAEKVFRGLDIVRRVLGAERGFIACEINKPAALKRLREVAAGFPAISAQALDTRYPHGAEKHLIKAVLNREVPIRALPGSVGVIVNNVQTVCAIADAVDLGRVLHSRVITVSGHGITTPKNLRIPLGTSVSDAIAFCDGESVPEPAVIVGGPMTGMRVTDFTIPVGKSTSGIVLLTEEEYGGSLHMACIRCGKCVEVCPMYLPPNRITAYVNNDMIEEAVGAGLDACILCGACQFVCPSKRPLLEWINHGKAVSAAKRRR